MAKVRIYEWAKQNNMASKTIIADLKEKGHNVRNHVSSIEEVILHDMYKNEQKNEEIKSTKEEVKENNKKLVEQYPKPTEKKKVSKSNSPAGYSHPKPAGSAPRNPKRQEEYNKANPRQHNSRTSGYNNRSTSQGTSTGKYNNRPQQGGYNSRPGGYNNHKGGFKGEEKPEVQEQTSKPTTKKTGHSNAKKKINTYNNISKNVENNFKIDQRTKTAQKKEARKEREEALKNETTIIKWADDMTVSTFANLLEIPAIDLISKLFELGIMATMNQSLDKESAEVLCTDYNVEIIEDDSNSEFEFTNLIPEYSDDEKILRAPIVTIMGHVDHGKTTLLDTIRKTDVANKEAGGITQHIGAYQITHDGKKITFLDTPGHAAFSAMRARGAEITDIIILVVAADDGVMPQTKEAVAHVKEAKTPLIVAVNKIDKEGANPERVMTELSALGIISEEWGGDVPFINISAKNNQGIDELLSYIDVIAQIHEYKAPENVPGFGTVIEANIDQGRGPVATILVEGGEVHIGDPIVIGSTWGSIRAMQDENNLRQKIATTATPIEIAGLKGVPQAGERFIIIKDAKKAQAIGEKRAAILNSKQRNSAHAMSLDELNAKIAEGEFKELPIVIKADVQGSVEALATSLEKIDVNGVKVRIVHKGVGAINESDTMLCQTGNAIMIGFNVRPDGVAKKIIEKEKIDLMLSNIIYKIIEEIEDSMRGLRNKKYREDIIGYARVDEVFKITGIGKVAGCIVTEGKISRKCRVRLIRDDIVIYDGELGQLKRFKDDVNEVVEGMDCGMSFKGFNDIKKGDQFEGYLLEEIDLDKE